MAFYKRARVLLDPCVTYSYFAHLACKRAGDIDPVLRKPPIVRCRSLCLNPDCGDELVVAPVGDSPVETDGAKRLALLGKTTDIERPRARFIDPPPPAKVASRESEEANASGLSADATTRFVINLLAARSELGLRLTLIRRRGRGEGSRGGACDCGEGPAEASSAQSLATCSRKALCADMRVKFFKNIRMCAVGFSSH